MSTPEKGKKSLSYPDVKPMNHNNDCLADMSTAA